MFSKNHQSFFFRSLLVILLIVFLAIILFDLSLLYIDFQISRQARVLEKMPAFGRVIIDFGNGQKRAFEGEVPPEGLTLFEVLTLVSEAGNLPMSFRSDEKGGVYLVELNGFINENGHFWQGKLEKNGWQGSLAKTDLRRIYLEQGEVVKLIYR